MFINTTAFKKLIKNAYSTSGLTVGAAGEEYFFEGGTWVDSRTGSKGKYLILGK